MLTHSPKSYGVWAREGKKRQELTPHEILVDTIAETFNISCVDKELTEKVWKCDSVEVKCNTCLQWLDNRSSVSNDNVGPILRQKDKSNTDLYKLRFLWCLAIYSSQQAIYRLFFDNLKQSCLDFGLWMVKDTHLISMTSLSLPIFLESDSKRSKESFAEGKRYEVTITLVNRLVYYTRGVLCAVPWRHQDLASPARLPHLCLLLSVDHLAKKGFISTCGDCDAYKHTGPSGQSFSCCIIVSWSQFYDMTTI